MILREEMQILVGIGPVSAEKPKDSQHLVWKALGLSLGFAYRPSPPVMPTHERTHACVHLEVSAVPPI